MCVTLVIYQVKFKVLLCSIIYMHVDRIDVFPCEYMYVANIEL